MIVDESRGVGGLLKALSAEAPKSAVPKPIAVLYEILIENHNEFHKTSLYNTWPMDMRALARVPSTSGLASPTFSPG